MTNSERYRAAFSRVRAPEGAARRALEALEGPAPGRRKGKPLRLILAVAAAAALLIGSVGAEVDSGAVSNLLAPLFGGVRSQLAGDIGVPLGASVSADGYTLTADAMIGDRCSVAIVYTLSRDDGAPIPETVYFDQWDNTLSRFGSGSGSLSILRDEAAPHRIHLVESWLRSDPLLGRIVSVRFSGLTLSGEGDGTDTLLAQGPWELTFALRCRDAAVRIPARNLTVRGSSGAEYQIRDILLSPVGLRLEVTAPVPAPSDPGHYLMEDFTAALRLTDGRTVQLEAGKEGSWAKGDRTARAHYTARFEVPIPPEDVEALILCGAEIPAKGA